MLFYNLAEELCPQRHCPGQQVCKVTPKGPQCSCEKGFHMLQNGTCQGTEI